MKNQYFGDVNDYMKYGLLRSIIRVTKFRVLVAWMLTPDDGSPDGNLTSYLEKPVEWRHHDSELFDEMVAIFSNPGRKPERRVDLIENTHLLKGAEYFENCVPDSPSSRDKWFESLSERMRGSELVFLDPDNGLEIESKPYGRKESSKYVFWKEVEESWSSGKSLLIYQHFPRVDHLSFVRRKLSCMKRKLPSAHVAAFSTSRVVYLMALRPEHHLFHRSILDAVQKQWSDKITCVNLCGAPEWLKVSNGS